LSERTTPHAPADEDDRPMAGTCAAVLAVEALVLLALWAAGRYFGSA
jgi:hypothetical protein